MCIRDRQVIDLAARVFLDPGDTIIVEENSYGGAITAFRSYEANVIGVATDEEGIVPEALEAALKADPNVKLIYTDVYKRQCLKSRESLRSLGAQIAIYRIQPFFRVPLLYPLP